MKIKIQTRRDFITGILRNLIITVMAVLTGVFLLRKKNEQTPGEECNNRGLCSNCGRVKDCRLPQAADWQ